MMRLGPRTDSNVNETYFCRIVQKWGKLHWRRPGAISVGVHCSKHMSFQKVYICKRQDSRISQICSATRLAGTYILIRYAYKFLHLNGRCKSSWMSSKRFVARGRLKAWRMCFDRRTTTCLKECNVKIESSSCHNAPFKAWRKCFDRRTTTCLKECNVKIENSTSHNAPWRLFCNQTCFGVLPDVHVFQPLAK